MEILQDLGEMLRMAAELPLLAAMPLYLIAYGVAAFVIAKAIRAFKDIFK